MFEMQDIVDENDQVVAVMSREEIWSKGLSSQTRVVNVFIRDENGRFLVPTRSQNKNNWPECYDYACGENLLAGETYEQALNRGMGEELGLGHFEYKFLAKFTPADGEVCFMKVYLVNVNSQKFDFQYNPGEIDSVNWFTFEELQTLTQDYPQKFRNGYPRLFKQLFVK